MLNAQELTPAAGAARKKLFSKTPDAESFDLFKPSAKKSEFLPTPRSDQRESFASSGPRAWPSSSRKAHSPSSAERCAELHRKHRDAQEQKLRQERERQRQELEREEEEVSRLMLAAPPTRHSLHIQL